MAKAKSGENRQLMRKKRVQRLKKMIIGTVLAAILIPILVCICLLVRIHGLKGDIATLKSELQKIQTTISLAEEQEKPISETSNVILSDRDLMAEVSSNDIDDGKQKVYLTFDDGPSDTTEEILDILDFYEVKATFFVIGKEEEKYIPVYQRIVEDGHTLGMHSYSHRYAQIYDSLDNFSQDLLREQQFLYDLTGVWSRYYRFPGGSSNTLTSAGMDEFITYLDTQDIIYYDWNVSSGDASSGGLGKEAIVSKVSSQLENMQDTNSIMILMHDAVDKHTTIEALPQIIEMIQKMDNTEIVPITDQTVPVQHIRNTKKKD